MSENGHSQQPELSSIPLLPSIEPSLVQEYQDGLRLLYETAYRELCKEVTGEEPSDEPPDEAEFIEKVKEYLESRKEWVTTNVCPRYCKVKKSKSYWLIPIPLVLYIFGAIADATFTFGTASLSWITLRGILEEFCKCEPK